MIGRYAAGDLVGAIDEAGAWWARDGSIEVDVAAHHGRRFVLLGSVKWSTMVGPQVLDQLEVARDFLGACAAQARLVLFGRREFTPELRERAEREGVALVTAADLFA